MSNSQEKKLFQEFSPVTREEWEAVIQKDLKGADYQKKLIWKTLEGIDVKPYYLQEDIADNKLSGEIPGNFPFIRGKHADGQKWLIRQDIPVSNPQRAAEKAVLAVSRGAESVGFVFSGDKKSGSDDLKVLIRDIRLNDTEVNFASPGFSSDLVEAFLEEIRHRADKGNLKASFDFDPLGNMLLTGKRQTNLKELFEQLKVLILKTEEYPGISLIQVNGQNFQNSGSTIVQELAFSLAAGNEYITRFREEGLNTDQIVPRIKFCFAISSNYFMEIAKIRAARILWAKLTEAWGGSQKQACMLIHSVTSRFNKSVFDPYVNMLRTTTEAMSAILGGADSLTIEPFDVIFREQPGDLSERIARNTQIVLREEAYLDKISDPAAGSYYIESLTTSIAAEAWKLFLETEDQGGFTEAFEKGFFHSRIEPVAKKRVENLAGRTETLLGLNQYPNPLEKVSESIEREIFSPEVSGKEGLAGPLLKTFRMGEELEKLRLKTEKSSRIPVVFLLTYGNVTMRRTRAGFSANFFGCAGFRVIDNIGFETVEEGMKTAENENADVVVLCSSDEEYPAISPVASRMNKNSILVIAGYPREQIEALREAGVRHFIHMRSNLPETLAVIQKELGIV